MIVEIRSVFVRFHLNTGALAVATTTIPTNSENVTFNGRTIGQSTSDAPIVGGRCAVDREAVPATNGRHLLDSEKV